MAKDYDNLLTPIDSANNVLEFVALRARYHDKWCRAANETMWGEWHHVRCVTEDRYRAWFSKRSDGLDVSVHFYLQNPPRGGETCSECHRR
jgi:hypothetical protein